MTITTTELSNIISNVAVSREGTLENYVNVIDEDGNESEVVEGSSKFYKLKVEAMNRTFIVDAHEDPDGTMVVPSNGMIGAEERSDAINGCKGYFDLISAISGNHLGMSADVDDYDSDDVPAEVSALHDTLKEYLAMHI